MPLVNWKVELKVKWTNHSALSANCNDNDDPNSNNIIFTIKGRSHLSAKDKQKLSKLFSNGFERSMYWSKYKTKSEKRNTTNEYRYFLESNFVGVNRLFCLVYQIKIKMLKSIKPEGIFYYNVL